MGLGDPLVRRLSDEVPQSCRDGDRFETVRPDTGMCVWFRLVTGGHQPQAARTPAGDRLQSATLPFCVIAVETVEPRDEQRFLEDLSMRDTGLPCRRVRLDEQRGATAIEVEVGVRGRNVRGEAGRYEAGGQRVAAADRDVFPAIVLRSGQ